MSFTTLDLEGSLAPLYMYVQFRPNAASPLLKVERTSSSTNSREFGLVTPSFSVLTM